MIFTANSILLVAGSLFCTWLLARNLKKWKKDQKVERENDVGLWSVLEQLILHVKWTRDKSPTKLSFIERIYSDYRMKSAIRTLFRMLNINLVINDDYESVKTAMHDRKCSARSPDHVKELMTGFKNRGIIWNDGEVWKELRRYTIRKLGQLGMAKTDKLVLIFSDLLPELFSHLENLKGTTNNKIPVKNMFALSVVNVIWCTIGGTKFSRKDKDFEKVVKSIDIGTSSSWKLSLITRLPNNPFVNKLLGSTSLYESVAYLNDYVKVFVEKKMELSQGKQEPGDYVEHFLVEIEKHKENPDLKHIYSKGQLITVLIDLLSAGMDTTSNFLELSLMYMILNPKVQMKVQEEIDSVVGKKDTPSYSDHRMPYFCATMMEVHRMGSMLPLFARYIPKTNFHTGHVSQQETLVGNVIWAVRMEESFWGDPHTFRPERFLTAENELMMDKVDRVMPFGAGARSCPGENVASASSFTFLAALLQKYIVTRAVPGEFLGKTKNSGFVSQPMPFHAHFEKRTCE